MPTLNKSVLLKDIFPDWIREFSQGRNEPKWLQDLRVAAFEQYESLPLPDLKDERWKRTRLSSIAWDEIEFSPTPPVPINKSAEDLMREGVPIPVGHDGRAPALFFWELGEGHSLQLPGVLQKKGVEWLPLETAVGQNGAEIQAAWTKALEKAGGDKFQSLVLALATSGSCLFAKKETRIRTPLRQYIKGSKRSAAHFLLNFVFAQENTDVQLWDEFIPSSSAQAETDMDFLVSQTVMNIKENAKIQHFCIQNGDPGRIHFQFQDISQGAHSGYNSVVVAIGSRTFHNESSINLEGEGAENKILGVLFAEKTQTFENIIHQNHHARRTVSDIQFRGALKDESRSFFSGLIYIDPKAQQSDAYQSCKSLLLSRNVKADAIPNLEILADDVKCSHGAAAGSVDEEQKFYFQNRGIEAAKAEEIIVQGFVEPVIAAIPDEGTKEQLRGFIEEKMKG